MPYTIYVSQGRSARITKDTLQNDISGLVTDNFSTCNLIVCSNSEQVLLIHADMITHPEIIKNELEWLKEFKTINIFRKSSGIMIFNMLSKFFTETFPDKKVVSNVLKDEANGLLVSFDDKDNNNNRYGSASVTIYDDSDSLHDILYHPLHREIQTVQKIDSIIGGRCAVKIDENNACLEITNRDAVAIDSICIFNGLAWVRPNNAELSLDNNTYLKPKMSSFKRGSSFVDIYLAVENLKHEAAAETLEDSKIIILHASALLNYYINEYDYEFIFKKHLNEILEQNKDNIVTKKTSGHDREALKIVFEILKEKSPIFEKLKIFLDSYKNKPNQTAAKTLLLEIYYDVCQQYYNQKIQADAAQLCKEFKKKAVELLKQANVNVAKGEYASAVKLLKSAISHLSWGSYTDDVFLFNAYYSLSGCLIALGLPLEAKSYLVRYQELAVFSLSQSQDKLSALLQKCESQIPPLSYTIVAKKLEPEGVMHQSESEHKTDSRDENDNNISFDSPFKDDRRASTTTALIKEPISKSFQL